MNKLRTPSFVMYDTLKGLGIDDKVSMPLLFKEGTRDGDRAADLVKGGVDFRTKVRNVYEPGHFYEAQFSDFFQSAQKLCGLALKSKKAVSSSEQLALYLCGEPTTNMAEALNNYKLDGMLFANLIAKASASRNASKADVASLEMLIFVVTGCLGDLNKTVELAEQFSSRIASRSFKTETAAVKQSESPKPAQPQHLSLVRMADGAVDLDHPSRLSESPEGTVIGSMATGPSAVTNVGDMVSREHARIYRSEDGEWYIQGLGSTNGTTLISGSDKELIVVEPPRKERKGAAAPVPIHVGDAIVLAGTTTFFVVASM